MCKLTRIAAAALALVASRAARADTVDASATTFLYAAQQTRGGVPGQKPDLVTVVPLFEILNLSARDLSNPLTDDLSVVVNAWGSWDLAHERWDNGTNGKVTGDVLTGYVQGRFWDKRLTLRLGRENVVAGNARMLQIDGGDLVLVLPFNLGVSAFVGSPVSQRFAGRGTLTSWNPQGGTLAYGGRVFYQLPLPGLPGRAVEVGASGIVVSNGTDRPVRQDIGGDLRLQLAGYLSLLGYLDYSTYDQRFAEGNAFLDWTVNQRLHLNLSYLYIAPELLLSRDSILSVFSNEHRNQVGVGASYQLTREWTASGSYALVIEPGAPGKNFSGSDATARLTWDHRNTHLGGEFLWVDAFDNGYVGGRVFGRQDYGPVFAALDVLLTVFRDKINGEPSAVLGTLTGGYNIGRGWSAVLAGSAGMSPELSQEYQLIAKLTYNQTYHVREVR